MQQDLVRRLVRQALATSGRLSEGQQILRPVDGQPKDRPPPLGTSQRQLDYPYGALSEDG